MFSLESTRAGLLSDTETALKLARADNVEAPLVKPGFSLGLDFTSTPSERDLAEAAESLKVLSECDERVCITWPTGSFCTRTARTTDANGTGNADTPRGRAFFEAWNASS